jgi:hypothetical protein
LDSQWAAALADVSDSLVGSEAVLVHKVVTEALPAQLDHLWEIRDLLFGSQCDYSPSEVWSGVAVRGCDGGMAMHSAGCAHPAHVVAKCMAGVSPSGKGSDRAHCRTRLEERLGSWAGTGAFSVPCRHGGPRGGSGDWEGTREDGHAAYLARRLGRSGFYRFNGAIFAVDTDGNGKHFFQGVLRTAHRPLGVDRGILSGSDPPACGLSLASRW